MFCENCGKEIKDDAVFCPFCGNKSENVVVTSDNVVKSNVEELDNKKNKNNKKSKKGLIIAIAVAIICIFSILVGILAPIYLKTYNDLKYLSDEYCDFRGYSFRIPNGYMLGDDQRETILRLDGDGNIILVFDEPRGGLPFDIEKNSLENRGYKLIEENGNKKLYCDIPNSDGYMHYEMYIVGSDGEIEQEFSSVAHQEQNDAKVIEAMLMSAEKK